VSLCDKNGGTSGHVRGCIVMIPSIESLPDKEFQVSVSRSNKKDGTSG